MKTFAKLYTREFCIPFCEAWSDGYSRFFGVGVKTTPRNVFIVKNGLVEAYRHPKLNNELNELFYRQACLKKDFFNEFVSVYRERFEELEKECRKNRLEKAGLKPFLEKLSLFWVAIYGTFYVPGEERFSEGDRKKMIALREKIQSVADDANGLTERTLEAGYKELGRLAGFLTLGEFESGGFNAAVVRERQKKAIMVDGRIVGRAEFNDFAGRNDFRLEETFFDQKAREVKGQPACSGKAVGRVRLVLKREDVGRLEEGEVLVSTMTVPDFVPAMKRAAAYVTDEGGITCHAAIVAREFGKPCVIGTKIATKVLKNGDLVEVDATKGIVRKV